MKLLEQIQREQFIILKPRYDPGVRKWTPDCFPTGISESHGPNSPQFYPWLGEWGWLPGPHCRGASECQPASEPTLLHSSFWIEAPRGHSCPHRFSEPGLGNIHCLEGTICQVRLAFERAERLRGGPWAPGCPGRNCPPPAPRQGPSTCSMNSKLLRSRRRHLTSHFKDAMRKCTDINI